MQHLFFKPGVGDFPFFSPLFGCGCVLFLLLLLFLFDPLSDFSKANTTLTLMSSLEEPGYGYFAFAARCLDVGVMENFRTFRNTLQLLL